MLLYHGTTKSALVHIVDEGIKPRGADRGNWPDAVDSHPDAVYLTTSYALHFARCARDKYDDEFVAVVEIDSEHPSMKQGLFAPDEDFMEQATRNNPDFNFLKRRYKDMVERTAYFRERCRDDYRGYWEMSVQHLGTCAYYGHVPVEAITRYALIRYNHNLCLASDPTITLANYAILGNYYRHLTRLVFGDYDGDADPMIDPMTTARLSGLSNAGVRVFSRDPSNPAIFTATEAVPGSVATS